MYYGDETFHEESTGNECFLNHYGNEIIHRMLVDIY